MAELSPDVRALFERANFTHVATVMPDGSPHSVAVWAGLDGDLIGFFTQTTSQKARNIDRDPRVAISITDHDEPYKTARIRGRVVERRTGDEGLAFMDGLSVRHTGEPFPMRGHTGVAFFVEAEKVAFSALPFEHKPAG